MGPVPIGSRTEDLMWDFVERVNWDEYLSILEKGDPSIAVQLAIVNALLFCLWLFRRSRTGKARSRHDWLLPMIFAASNIAILSFGDRIAI